MNYHLDVTMSWCQWKSADLSPDKLDAGSPPFSIGTLLCRKNQFSFANSKSLTYRPLPPSNSATFALVSGSLSTRTDLQERCSDPREIRSPVGPWRVSAAKCAASFSAPAGHPISTATTPAAEAAKMRPKFLAAAIKDARFCALR